jgi:ElaB/YqjD/DUF883 family membrane-anchored ribosome-binding protein
MASYTGTTPDNGIKDQAKDKVEGLKDQVKGLVDAGQDKVHEVKDKLMDAKDKVVDKAGSFASTLEGRIKARPLASVAIAFGIGYFAMRIFRR